MVFVCYIYFSSSSDNCSHLSTSSSRVFFTDVYSFISFMSLALSGWHSISSSSLRRFSSVSIFVSESFTAFSALRIFFCCSLRSSYDCLAEFSACCCSLHVEFPELAGCCIVVVAWWWPRESSESMLWVCRKSYIPPICSLTFPPPNS